MLVLPLQLLLAPRQLQSLQSPQKAQRQLHLSTTSYVADFGKPTQPANDPQPTKAPKGAKKPDIQSQIFALAEALGVAPADLSAAIRPLTDPTVPNPAEQQKKLEQQLEEAKANGGKDAAETDGPSVLGLMGEVFLD